MTLPAPRLDTCRTLDARQPGTEGSRAGRGSGPTAWTGRPCVDEAVDVVAGFLRDVRSGRALHLAPHYLAEEVLAHQGPPGLSTLVVRRSPQQYSEHVAEMLRSRGPWDFDVLRVVPVTGGVVASWRQVGSRGRRPVERGRATYQVDGGRITQYWVQADERTLRHEQRRHHREVDVVRRVAAPPSVVWDLLSNPASWARWGPWSGSSQAAPAGPTFRLSLPRWGPTLQQVVAVVPGQRLSLETLAGSPVSGVRTDVALRPEADGTTVWWHTSFDGGARAVVVQPLLAHLVRGVLRSLARRAVASADAR